MKGEGNRETGASLGALVREIADGLGHLVTQHLKLAQIELTANLRAIASRAGLLAVCGVLMIVGYTLAMAGIAVLVGGDRALGVPLLGVGAVHVVGSGVGILVLLARLRRASLMKETAGVVGESAAALLAPNGTSGPRLPAVEVESTASAVAVRPRPLGSEAARER